MSLDADIMLPPGQLFACVSIVGPECPQKNDKFGIKLRGSFGTQDEAAKWAARLQKEDATFDIYVVEVGKWLLIPPDPEKIEDTHYANEKLEELMAGYRENQAAAAKMFAERKRDLMERPDKNYIKAGDENSKFYTKPDEAPISHPSEVIERLKTEKPGLSMEEYVKEADAVVAAEIERIQAERGPSEIKIEDVPAEEEDEESK